jgi:uroporphyrin-III C-methyltransferase/precorrin-2 dehydrogenase/sirohydrochlorin ferrochelatase/uroporphyrin-III C-methyltransferase
MVYLVGAGPGDPDLLTVKAMRLIAAEADVVVYDRLVSEDIMDYVPPGTARIFVGKATNRHTLPQEDINDLLVRLAKSGRTVVRLKGGDPFIFGRGGEEAEFLRAHDVPFEVIPGITAGSGCAAYAGIPLTHRGMATGVRYVTGHCQAGVELDLNWASLADPDTTLVVYMGLAHLPEISVKLIAAGLPAETPAAAIANGTTRDQQTCLTTLAGLPQAAKDGGLRAPVMVIIGKVVDMAAVLAKAPAGFGVEVNREQFGAD